MTKPIIACVLGGVLLLAVGVYAFRRCLQGHVAAGTVLWHYSGERIEGSLEPKLGHHRHDLEDERLAGKPAVWLSSPRLGSAAYTGDLEPYEYEVVVPRCARVYKCRAHATMVSREAAMFNEMVRAAGNTPMDEDEIAPHRYYGSLDALPITRRRKWNPEAAEYVEDR